MKLLICIGMLFTMGCATTSSPGGVSISTSKFDGVKQVVMVPGWVSVDGMDTGPLMLGGYKTTKMEKDEAVLIVRHNKIKNFSGRDPNFMVKVDGKLYKLSPISDSLDCKISSKYDPAHCTQKYFVKVSFLRKMAQGKSVKFKLLLRDDTYVVDILGPAKRAMARKGLLDFLVKIKEL